MSHRDTFREHFKCQLQKMSHNTKTLKHKHNTNNSHVSMVVMKNV